MVYIRSSQLVHLMTERLYPSTVSLLPFAPQKWQPFSYSLFLSSTSFFSEWGIPHINYAVFVFLCLIYLSKVPCRFICVVTHEGFPSCKGWIIFHCVYTSMCHILFIHSFIHSFIDRHLSCFYTLTIVHELQWAWECKYFFEKMPLFSLDATRSGIAGSYGSSFLALL